MKNSKKCEGNEKWQRMPDSSCNGDEKGSSRALSCRLREYLGSGIGLVRSRLIDSGYAIGEIDQYAPMGIDVSKSKRKNATGTIDQYINLSCRLRWKHLARSGFDVCRVMRCNATVIIRDVSSVKIMDAYFSTFSTIRHISTQVLPLKDLSTCTSH